MFASEKSSDGKYATNIVAINKDGGNAKSTSTNNSSRDDGYYNAEFFAAGDVLYRVVNSNVYPYFTTSGVSSNSLIYTYTETPLLRAVYLNGKYFDVYSTHINEIDYSTGTVLNTWDVNLGEIGATNLTYGLFNNYAVSFVYKHYNYGESTEQTIYTNEGTMLPSIKI